MSLTDLRAARSGAHVWPVLFVIHVIGKPAKREEAITTDCCKYGAEVLLSGHSYCVITSAFLFAQRQCRQVNHTQGSHDAFNLLLHHVFIVEAVCNKVDAKDDGCFTLRHSIISKKMIPLVPAGEQLS